MSAAGWRTRGALLGHAQRLALEFWERAGGGASFPREPEAHISLNVPLSLVPIPALSCAALSAWCRDHRLPLPDAGPERALRGCLMAAGDGGYLFYDPRDPPAERRVTLAHELGHFLIDVAEPRRRVRRAVGDDALAVLEGERPPTTIERLYAVLGDAPLAPQLHLMTRQDDGSIGCDAVADAEDAADAFALELLAPHARLVTSLQALSSGSAQQRWSMLTDLLLREYGLPPLVAGGYATRLIAAHAPDPSVSDRLGL